ncbi:serine hydrolase [Limimaricola sp.]|uniref:serine hydrolase n=1 Tax=Limimaricola sp. TaxID=2211665 RepID=UPI0025C1740F|nr:serine hydrolase [Limimaricola sp.]
MALAAAPFAAYVMDARTGEEIYSRNADTPLNPASLTKMMTLYLAFQDIERGKISLDTLVTVTREAASQPPSKLGLRTGQRIALRYLIRAAAVKSANDCAAAIGIALEGSTEAFAARMTATARAMGMTHTTFRNANGLTLAGHLSSAHDMSILGRHVIYDFPQYYNLFSRRTADAGIATVRSTNRHFLDAYEGADGIKTGYTSAAGFNLVASAQRGNERIIATVFGGTSTADRNAKVAQLLDMGFAHARSNERLRPPTPAPVIEGQGAIVVAGDAGGAAKTVRVNGLVSVSLRPLARSTALAQVDSAVNTDVIASAVAAALEPTPPAAPDGPIGDVAAVVPEPRPADLAVADASPDTATDPTADPATDPNADPTVVADGLIDGSDEDPPVAGDGSTVVAATDPLPPSDATPAAPDLTLAADSPTPSVSGVQQLAATIDTAVPTGAIAPEARPDPAPAAAATGPLMLAASDTTAASAGPEVISRVSTSGGRIWGINVGRYNSRFEAEKALLRIALNESGILDGSLRKVMQKPGGYDADFMGLDRDTADLACRRLQARGTTCFMLGTEG